MKTHTTRLRLPSLDSLGQDLRYAFRTLRGSPGFTTIAVLTLALGIGATTAIFSLVSAVLLKPLPFAEPDRLVLLWENFSPRGGPDRVEPTPATVAEWRKRSRSYEAMAMLLGGEAYNLTGGGEPERLAGVRTDTNLFAILGLQPIVGRTFVPDDEGPDATPVAVISERLWERRFGADPGLIGRTIVVNGLSRTVIGVVPNDFRYPYGEKSIWVPAAYTPDELAAKGIYNYDVVARLRTGVDLATAQAELDTIAAAMQSEQPDAGQIRFTVSRLQEHLSRSAKPTLFILLAAVGTILAITCANVANLLLARGAQRNKELAVRKAIGAASTRVLRQLLTESGVLAVAGVALGIAISTLGFAYLTRLMPSTLPRADALGLDWRVLVFAAGVTVLTVLLFGAGPALVASRRGFNDALRTAVGASAAPRIGRMRDALVVAEITLTVVLLAAAGLLLRSYAAVLAVDPGFRSDHLLVVETPLTPSKYGELAARMNFYRRVLESVRSLPGVANAGYVNFAPLVIKGGRAYVSIEGNPSPPENDFSRNVVADRVAGEGYLETLGVRLLSGRQFDSRDGPDAAPSAIVNESMARRFWPDGNAVGHRLKIGAPESPLPWATVIGVVTDVHQMGLDVAAEPEFVLSASQSVVSAPFFWPGHLLVRTRVEPLTLAAAVRNAVWQVDADQPVASIRTMDDLLTSDVASRDTQLNLVGAFAALALLLAAVGLYGVLSYSVSQRTAEIGLRMALGAEAAAVLTGVVRGALWLAALGIALGLAVSFGVTRFLGSFLYGVSPTDPATLASVAALLIVVTVLASWIPARRAARIDPMLALRSE
jgi:predicted permease